MYNQRHRRWMGKPPVGCQLDRSNPVTSKIEGAWMFNDGPGLLVRDIANAHNATVTNTSVWDIGIPGRINKYTNTGSNCASVPYSKALDFTTPMSMLCRFRLDSAPVSGNCVLVSRGYDGFNVPYFLDIDDPGGGILKTRFGIYLGGVGNQTALLPVPTVGHWITAVGTISGSNIVLSLHDELTNTVTSITSANTTLPPASSGSILGFAQLPTLGRTPNCSMTQVVIWTRSLMYDEMTSMINDPNQIIAQPPQNNFYAATGTTSYFFPRPSAVFGGFLGAQC